MSVVLQERIVRPDRVEASVMSGYHLVRRTQYALCALVLLSALAWSGAVLFGLLTLTAIVQWRISGGETIIDTTRYFAVVAAIATGVVLSWRARFTMSRRRVALWIEEQAPELRYALVTLIDPACANTPVRVQLESLIAPMHITRAIRRAAARTVLPAATLLTVTSAGLVATPDDGSTVHGSLAAVSDPPVAVPMANRLASIRATLTPPPYTAMSSTTLTNPLTLSGVTGTRAIVTGRGLAGGVTAELGGEDVDVYSEGGGWAAEFSLPDSAAAFTLRDREFSRVIVIDPRPDRPPDVGLTVPAQDLTLRVASGSLTVEARIVDDIAIARGSFEYIVSSGEGEGNITARSGELGARAFGGAKSGTLSLAVPYARFDLREGDVLAIRAVARDANDVTGPGIGRSETRNIRIARQSEYDELAITSAPRVVDETALSLRMLIIATEKLAAQRRELSRPDFVQRSVSLGREADGMRRKLEVLIDEQSGGGLAEVDPRLDAALAHMWDGVRALNVAEPDEALPHLRGAYDILTQLRDAEKYYLRGRSPPVIVNIDRVRLTGTEPVRAIARTPRASGDGPRDELRRRYAEAVELLPTDPARAFERFMNMRVLALREAPAAAAVLEQVVEALHTGVDATVPLLEARRVIEGASRAADSLPIWSSGW